MRLVRVDEHQVGGRALGQCPARDSQDARGRGSQGFEDVRKPGMAVMNQA